MTRNLTRISKLVESQLPEFITFEYPKFTAFIQKYYEQLENTGQPLNILNNLSAYQDIDFYERKILEEFNYLVSITEILDSNDVIVDYHITLKDAESFPNENGYILIDDEVIFYKQRVDNTFTGCYRNVSGTTKLGDLYEESTFNSVAYSEFNTASPHLSGVEVYNISNLFLYAFVKNFESQYLASFPEESLKPEVDKRQLLKNIRAFYQSKGTEQSIKFIFNSIVAKDTTDVPSIYYPKDNTLKSSTSGWINKYALKVKVISGDILKIIGQKIYQTQDIFNLDLPSASAIVDNVKFLGNYDNETFYELVLAPESVVGEFDLAKKTFLTKSVNPTDNTGNRINVFSTFPWNSERGKVLIGNEQFVFSNKNINQFYIENRSSNGFYDVKTPVYDYKTLVSSYIENGVTYSVSILPLGVLYNLNVDNNVPFSSEGDLIQIDEPGFTTRDSIIYNPAGNVRWKINNALNSPPNVDLQESIANVSAIFEDESYYYITSSGFSDYFTGIPGLQANDQKHLKLIRKNPSSTTEIYKTESRDVGIFVNGVTAYSFKDYDANDIVYGGIESFTVKSKGTGYKNPPYVLIAGDRGASARAIMSGEVVESIEVLTKGEDYSNDPEVTITSGRGATVEAIVTKDRVTSLVITNPGEYYSSPPIIRIIDSENIGRLAEYTSIISSDGKLIGFNKINEGKFYKQGTIRVVVEAVGRGASAAANTKRWKKNRYEILKNSLDSNNGYLFENYNRALGLGYAHVASPSQLRSDLGDDGQLHSPILGYAYDGNPIYGPYGFENPLDTSSSVIRMSTSYKIDPNYENRPGTSLYPIGSLVEDYKYQHRLGTLDENNGRFCVTPDYPNGVYAYFITVDDSDLPTFPYILGENYYSIPVDSNYNKSISQLDIPRKVKRFRVPGMPSNGNQTIASVETVNSGGVSSFDSVFSSNNLSVGSTAFINNNSTNGSGCTAEVSGIKGKQIISLESQQTKASLLKTVNSVYLFDGSILTQENSGATGEVVGDVLENNRLVLRNITGDLNLYDRLNSSIRIVLLLTDRPSFYSKDSILKLTNGKQVTVNSIDNNRLLVASNPFEDGETISFPQQGNGIEAESIYYVVNSERTSFQLSETLSGSPVTLDDTDSFGVVANSEIAKGRVLEDVLGTNTVKILVLDGDYLVGTTDYLRSSTLDDTLGARIFRIDELSKNIEITEINDNIGLVTTADDHKLTENDTVFLDIIPDDNVTTTTYHVRKRIYQKVQLEPPSFSGSISDTGIGVLRTLNPGFDYASSGSGVYNNVELIFADQTRTRNGLGSPGNSKNARANITVSSGRVSNVEIVYKGTEYVISDVLTVNDDDLERLTGSLSQSVLYVEVAHVGLGEFQNEVFLSTVEGLSVNDYLKIDSEIVKITSVNESSLSVSILRPLFGTIRSNHYNGAIVSLHLPRYNFTEGYQIGPSTGDAIVKSYNPATQELLVYFDLNQTVQSVNSIAVFSSFRDSGSPSKLVRINSIIESASYRFEFSKDTDQGPWIKNPIISVQTYYRYKFVTSHPSLAGSYLEFSPSSNYNIVVKEVTKGNIIPGSGDENSSFVTVKFGFGSAISSNNFDTKQNVDFNKIFYFDKANIIENESSHLSLIDDPLQGQKTLSYVSPRSFVYELDRIPQYDGTGQIYYTTSSKFAIGEISTVSITNPGQNYKKLPTLYGFRVPSSNECLAEIQYDLDTRKISSISVSISGKNYVKPLAVLIYEGRVVVPNYRVVLNNTNGVVAIINEDKNLLFNTEPQIFVIESSVNGYFGSKTIGTIKNITITENGSGYYDDYSILPRFTSSQFLTISNFDKDHFINGEIIEQYENGTLIASAKVAKDGYKNDINILKVIDVDGQFKPGLTIRGKYKRNICLVTNINFALISPIVKSFYDNQGYYDTDSGQTSSANQRITDSYFYQDYSYVIKSKSTIDVWRKLIKQTAHPAGFNLFGEVLIEADSKVDMPLNQPKSSSVTIVELWDPQKNRVTVESTKRQLTQTIVKFSDINVQRGEGSVYASEYDTSETLSFVFLLSQPFDGDFDESGNRSGRTTFNMVVPRVLPDGTRTNIPLNVINQNNLVVTLDGILQEPGVAFTVSGSQITFAQSPLGQRISQGQDVEPQKFSGRFIRFKADSLNNQYFRKIENIDHLFDNQTTRFPLYYENGDPVSLDSKENLLVSLDGVLQENKMTPLIPATSAYYINRNIIPNEIVFVKPPVSLGEKGYQHFFAYSVGNYERLKIDSSLISNSRGPFLVTSVLGDRVINVDNDRNLLVFVDGILQIRNRAYFLNGPFISFAEPLKLGQNVNILYLYGREIEKTLTMFNFEENNFFNVVDIVIDNFENNLGSVQQYVKLIQSYRTVYQGDSFIRRSAVGEVLSTNLISSVDYPGALRMNIRLRTQNQLFSPNYDLKFSSTDGYTTYLTIPLSKIVSITPFEEDEETREIVKKVKTGWLYGTSLSANEYNKIDEGDLIKVDGEKDYRKVLSIPRALKKVGHREEDLIQTNHFGIVNVTQYNGMIEGVGLTISASLTGDKVTSLTWNNRNYELIESDLNSDATAFGYSSTPKLVFLPQPELDTYGNIIGPVVGGGAAGYAIMSKGEIIDVVLTNSGSGYRTPPKVLVTRGFDFVKSPEKIIRKSTVLDISPKIFLDTSITRVITTIRPPSLNPEIQTVSDISSKYDSTQPTVIVLPPPVITRISDEVPTNIVSELHLSAPEITSVSHLVTTTDTYYEFSLSVTCVDTIVTEKVVNIDGGFTDIVSYDLEDDRYIYGQMGNKFSIYENIKYADIGVAALSQQNTIEEMDLHYPNIILADFSDRPNSSISSYGNIWDATWPSIQEHGAILDSSINDTDDVIYVPNTSRFPDSGQLIIGGSLYDGDQQLTSPSSSAEVVYYTSKLSDRFLGVTRGQNITVAQSHSAGVYLRSLLDEYRFDFQVLLGGIDLTDYPSYYYTRDEQYIQLQDNLFIPRNGAPFALI